MSSRRRKPLYPHAWGSGTKPFEATYKVFSVGACGRDDLEAGDKVILPEAAFREVSRLRLEFPLMMHVKSVKKAGPRSKSMPTTNSVEYWSLVRLPVLLICRYG